MKILLIDQYSLIFRSYYAFAKRPIIHNMENFSAVYGFFKILLSLLKDKTITHIAVCGDSSSKLIRQEYYPNYKSDRKSAPLDLEKQFNIIDDILMECDIKLLKEYGYEADDIIATLCKSFPGVEILIYSSDKDFNQLVDNNISVMKNDENIIDKNYIEKEFKFLPQYFIEYQALAGDGIDSIPGVKGIGDTIAKKLVRKFKTLEGIYENIESLDKRQKNSLINGKEDAFLSRKLATLINDIDIFNKIHIDELSVSKIKYSELYNNFFKYNFSSLIKTLKSNFNFFESSSLFELSEDNNDFEISDDKNISSPDVNILFSDETNFLLYKTKHNLTYKIEDFLSVKDILESQELITFDYKEYLKIFKKFNINANIIFDIKTAGYLLNSELKDYSVLNLAKSYSLDTKIKYPYMVFRLYKILTQEIQKKELLKLLNLEIKLIQPVVEMEQAGITIDLEKMDRYLIDIEIEMQKNEKEIFRLNDGEKFNIMSSKQLQDILFVKLNLNAVKKTQTGNSVDIDVLEILKPGNPIIEYIIEYKHLQKLSSTYLEPIKAFSQNGKIHTNFLLNSTTTGRISCSNPNLQNIPRGVHDKYKIRELFIASKDNILVSFDYNQIELMILTYFSKDEILLNCFLNDLDIHKITASKVLNIPIENVSSQDRQFAKAINYGVIYGMQSHGLKQQINVSRQKAQEYIDEYYKAHSGVRNFLDNVFENVKETHMTKTILNRIRHMQYSEHKYLSRIAPNSIIQGSASDIIKKSMVDIYENQTLKDLKVNMVLQIHDELIFEIPKENKDKAIILIKDIMENVVDLSPLKLKVSVSYGYDMYNLEELDS